VKYRRTTWWNTYVFIISNYELCSMLHHLPLIIALNCSAQLIEELKAMTTTRWYLGKTIEATQHTVQPHFEKQGSKERIVDCGCTARVSNILFFTLYGSWIEVLWTADSHVCNPLRKVSYEREYERVWKRVTEHNLSATFPQVSPVLQVLLDFWSAQTLADQSLCGTMTKTL
jgi:hypothetical protein